MEQYDIIVVDDEEVLTRMFADASRLLSPNKKVRVFTNAEEVYLLLDEKKIHSHQWVLDYMMPKKNGSEIAAKIRKIFENTPSIYLYSAYFPKEFGDLKLKINGWYSKATTDIFTLLS